MQAEKSRSSTSGALCSRPSTSSAPSRGSSRSCPNSTPACQVKCDRAQPSCGWCSRNNAPCEYKERKKPGLRAGYGRELEQRLDRLESILKTHSEILQVPMDTGQPGSTVVAGSGSARGSRGSARGSIPSLSSDHGTPREIQPSLFTRTEAIRTSQAETPLFLPKSSPFPASNQGIDYGIPPHPVPAAVHDGFSSQVAMAGMSPTHATHPPPISSAAAQEYYRTSGGASVASLSSPPIPMGPGQAQMSVDQDLPTYDLLYALVDLYFKHINTWCPILHRKTTLDSLFGQSMIEETDKILLHAIVATTLRYLTDARLTDERRQHYHDVSKQRVLLYGMENSSVKALQALVILALDLCGSGNGPPGWNISTHPSPSFFFPRFLALLGACLARGCYAGARLMVLFLLAAVFHLYILSCALVAYDCEC